ncbi:hypothetical protein M3Y98_01182300 [Aphelenchoides besseyi]|nr:hypothetical protein M3Y98_01182300 [Aphelenchoides besseyi]KAI6211088.1 hypothetical protein M3Y96_00396000 [Aphelenchoides besseyi]
MDLLKGQSLNFTSADCAAAYVIRSSGLLNVFNSFQVVLSVVSLITIYNVSSSKETTKVFSILSKNLKVLISVGTFGFLGLTAVTVIILYSYILAINLIDQPPCFYVWPALHCFFFRSVLHYCVVGFTVLHVVILIERSYVAFVAQHNDQFDMFGRMLVVGLFIVPFLVIVFMYGSEDLTHTHRVYCTAGSSRSTKNVIFVTYVCAAVDLVTTIADFFLHLSVKKQARRLLGRNSNYQLEKSFVLKEIRTSIRVIYPLSVVHTIALAPFPFIYIIGRPQQQSLQLALYVEAALLFKTMYTVIVPCTLWFLKKRKPNEVYEWMKPMEEQRNVHFIELSRYFDRKL